VLRGPRMRTGTVTSRSIVKDLRKSKKETSSVSAGLSDSSDAKGGETILSGRELSTHDLTSGAEPFAGTPLEGLIDTGESLQSILSTVKTEYLLKETETGETTEEDFL